MKRHMLSLKEIQKEELNVLKDVIDFLDKNNIKYYIWAGSFLGAVRHKGFIPWDDDIDIAIMRDDYDKLIRILKEDKSINKKISAIGFEIGESYFPFIKFINKKISIKEETNINKHLWIDVFPIDGTSNSLLFLYKVRLYRFIYSMKRIDIYNLPIKEKKLIKKIIKSIFKILLKPISFEKFIERYISLCSKYKVEDSNFIANNVWRFNMKEIYPKKLFSKASMYPFEDIKVKGVEDYDNLLSIEYGDYMKLPKEEDRVTHSFEAWYDEK